MYLRHSYKNAPETKIKEVTDIYSALSKVKSLAVENATPSPAINSPKMLEEIYKEVPKFDNSLFELYLNSEIGNSKVTLDTSKSEAYNQSIQSIAKIKEHQRINSLSNLLGVSSPVNFGF